MLTLRVAALVWILCTPALAQQIVLSWQEQVRKYAKEQDWSAAMNIVNGEIARAPQDMDVRTWRARLLLWSGQLADAEREYRYILAAAPNDPDNWMGLASVYFRQDRAHEAEQALERALALDPTRADIHAARGRALRAEHALLKAKIEFQRALELDRTSEEARAGLRSLRADPKHELRIGSNTDLFSFADANHDQQVSLTSQWTGHWRTTIAGGFYRWAGIDGEKLTGSITGKLPRCGALTIGAATAHDNGVIPRDEAFFDYDRGWKLGSLRWVRALETDYGQHWYWYSTARVFTISAMTVFYLPQEWTWSIGLTGARSSFSASESEWRPSGITRIGFPIAGNDEHRLKGNVFFATGTENFAQVNEIGRFFSQTYGGGLRFQLTRHQEVGGTAAYLKRTQDRREISFGLTYAVRF